jgi:carbon-monoxide dehydrogenase medium subunit
MIPFDWAEPETLKEAVALLDPEDTTVRPIAGGTALMLMMKAGVFTPTRLISLAKIERRYSEIRLDPEGALHVGAMATLSDLEQSPHVKAHFKVIRRALHTLSNVRVRNVARVGGALAHGDPHMDLPPLLAALGARVVAVGPNGTREIPVEQLYAGYYETTLDKNELIAEAIVPSLENCGAAYQKVTSRSADDWPALNMGVWTISNRYHIQSIRIVVSAATDKVTRLTKTEKMLSGAMSDSGIMPDALQCAADEVSFLSDMHGSAAYKKELLRSRLGVVIRTALFP